MRYTLLFSICLLLAALPAAFGQKELFGGSIHVEQIGNCSSNKIRVEAMIYGKKDPTIPTQDSITIHWGDGNSKKIGRVGNNILPGEIAELSYAGDYTYDAPGQYNISLEACCLTEAFDNFDSSPPVSLKINAVYSLFDGQFQGCNSTAQLLTPLVDGSYIGQLYNFNPNASDPEGDSLAYSLFNPLSEFNYLFPDELLPTTISEFSINQKNGTITWDRPIKAGDYLVGLKVDEYRNQARISETFHLLEILISDTSISLFPNPTSSELTVNLSPATPDEKLKVRIYNALGQLALSQDAVFNSTGHTIDVHDFANGVYLLEVEALGRGWVRKFVKL